jgi:hypothetical protein
MLQSSSGVKVEVLDALQGLLGAVAFCPVLLHKHHLRSTLFFSFATDDIYAGRKLIHRDPVLT